ncbi:Serine/arginine-rich splicing factor SR45 [Vitis vinifera]|uniref:Serine/arginine-rich splicing factor SR45 n=1 Tax=Vitis vinifera TaxID=29760 RepID=A0A438E3E8_VITVI|nr:Serine/arginine-rich splicing factor SR45 [Vitis vinifera]
MDRTVNLPKDMDMLNSRQDLMLKKLNYTWMAQIDGNVVRAKFTLPQRQKISSPPKAVATASKRDGPKTDNVGADVEKDGPKRQREASPRRKPPSPPRRRSPAPGRRGGSPRRQLDSPQRRRGESPIRRRVESPYRRGETPPRRRPASPSRGRSPLSPPSGIDHLQGPLPEGCVAVLSAGDLHLLQGAGN